MLLAFVPYLDRERARMIEGYANVAAKRWALMAFGI